jgi:hypothetical protein
MFCVGGSPFSDRDGTVCCYLVWCPYKVSKMGLYVPTDVTHM